VPFQARERRARSVASGLVYLPRFGSLWNKLAMRNFEPLTSSGTWSLIAISIFACCVAVVSSKWYREQREKRERAFGGEYGRRPWRFSTGMATSSGSHITSRSGVGSTCSSGLRDMPASLKPRREFIPWRPGMKYELIDSPVETSQPTTSLLGRWLTPRAIIPTLMEILFPPTLE
jgi:hypothetical protein